MIYFFYVRCFRSDFRKLASLLPYKYSECTKSNLSLGTCICYLNAVKLVKISGGLFKRASLLAAITVVSVS